MQSRTRSMSMPVAGDGTPSRWSCALKSRVASSVIGSPLNPAHEPSRVEDPIRIEGLLERTHDGKARWRRSPDVNPLFDGGGSRSDHYLPLGAGRVAQS